MWLHCSANVVEIPANEGGSLHRRAFYLLRTEGVRRLGTVTCRPVVHHIQERLGLCLCLCFVKTSCCAAVGTCVGET
ncbi:hypothetical protein scyTo_0007733 [Scyliorhinus torazame]|uniref:Uncharacterized protein n=1 Tax=Scyliorhinus torazame TaxID=75743 RepID=A0A401NXA7_SCYTO|nr:hypothetical protein [Scyliorhinus torazame]